MSFLNNAKKAISKLTDNSSSGDEEEYEDGAEINVEDNSEPIDSGTLIQRMDAAAAKNAEKYEKAKDGEIVDKESTSDVLEALEIPATFELSEDLFFPEDFEDNIKFDLEYPNGYSRKQVSDFIVQVERTVNEYYDLLIERNKHIAILASHIDRLTVDFNNFRFDTQIANGISVMPTSDAETVELENALNELQIKYRQLEEKLEEYENSESGDEASPSVRAAMNDLHHELSIKSKENKELKHKIYLLENAREIAENEEFNKDLETIVSNGEAEDNDMGVPDLDDGGIPDFGDIDDIPSPAKENDDDDELPGFGDIDGSSADSLGDDDIPDLSEDNELGNLDDFGSFDDLDEEPQRAPAKKKSNVADGFSQGFEALEDESDEMNFLDDDLIEPSEE